MPHDDIASGGKPPGEHNLEIAVFAGDASGDMQASHLISALRNRVRQLRVWGVGGRRMREAGVDLLFDTSRASAIGFIEAMRLIPQLLATKALALRQLKLKRPDFVVAVDFGAFNLRVMPNVRKLGIPVAYWFPPGSWRRSTPSQRVIDSADFFISPYPWYAENLRSAGAQAEFLGHPLIDQVKPSLSRSEFLQRMEQSEDSNLVALLPGSRRHEVEHILPVMVRAAAVLWGQDKSLSFVVPLSDHYPVEAASKVLKRLTKNFSNGLPMALARGATQETICHSRAAVICSGSATLEALVAGTPMVVVYRGSQMMKLEYRVRRMNIKYMGMPNILADDLVVPELRQDDVTPKAIASHLADLLIDGPVRQRQIQKLGELRTMLLPVGAIGNTADSLLSWHYGRNNHVQTAASTEAHL